MNSTTTKIIEDKELRNRNYVFMDRFHAGELLAQKLKPYIEPAMNPIVLAIPSGGVPVGITIAKKLDIPMDLIIVRKIPIPDNPEAGFGSISWDGEVMINRRLVKQLQLNEAEIDSAVQKVRLELTRRMEKFRGKKPFPQLKGRTVIIVDDGLASGYTMLSAVNSIRKYSPAAAIVAVPTASVSALELVSPQVDKIFCLNIRDTMMFAVADAYQEWYDLSEEEVVETLKAQNFG
jgi:predicted phosphoribosyltransferase